MKNTLCSWMRLTLNYKFNEIPIKILIGLFYGTGQIYPKVHLEKEMYKSSQENYEQEKKCDKGKVIKR